MSDLKITCIIVDDEPMALNLVESYVEKTPFLVLKKKCSSAIEAMEFIKTEPVDLLFLDINLPGMSGWDMMEILRQKQKFGDFPIIAVTAQAMRADIVRAQTVGQQGHGRTGTPHQNHHRRTPG